jgi:RecB family endonuclease NucS
MEKVAETTFEQEKLFERRDLQRLIRADVSVLSLDLMVIAEEYGEWEDSNRRIDLLCLDKESHLVVVELKRTEDGGHMDLQAIRYASMVSSMTFDELIGAHARFVGGDEAYQKAESAILRFLKLESPSEAKLDDEV